MNKQRLRLLHVPPSSSLCASSSSRLSHLPLAEATTGRANRISRERTSGKSYHLHCLSSEVILQLSPAYAILDNSSSPFRLSRLHLAAGGGRRVLWVSRECAIAKFWLSTSNELGDDDEQRNPVAHADTLNNVCKILENSSSLSCLSQLLQPYANDISPALIALVVQRQKSLPHAKHFFQWASSIVRPDQYAYHSLLIKLGEFKEFADMWKLVEVMKCQGYQVSSTTLSIIIKAYGSADLPHEAMEVCAKAHQFNVTLDCHIFTTLLSVLFKAKLIDHARSIHRKMLKSSCTFDGSAWATLIRGFGKNGCAEEAEACWDSMLYSGLQPVLVHYNALIEGLCESKSMNKALLTLMAMQEQGIKPNTYSFNPILGALCKLHRFPEALNIFSSMKMFCAPNQATCNILLEGLLSCEDVSEACELFEKMEQDGMVDTRSYVLLTAGLKKAKQTDKLLSICQSMHVKKNDSVDDVISNAILQCLYERQDVEKAMDFFKGLKNPNVASYAMMINSLCRVGKLDEAMMLLVDMIDKGCKPNAFCYAPLMGGNLKCGRLEDGFKLFNDMVRRGIETNDVTCSFLLRKLNEAQMADAVLQVCKHVADNSIVLSNAVWDLSIKTLESAGRADAAVSLRRSLAGQHCVDRQALKAGNCRLKSGRAEAFL